MLARLVILLILSLSICGVAKAQGAKAEAASKRYSVQIDMGNAGISGICLMKRDDKGDLLGAIINEFGVAALSFSYDSRRERVEILDIIAQLDKWYIKRVVKADLKSIVPQMMTEREEERYEYYNARYKIRYRFAPLNTK